MQPLHDTYHIRTFLPEEVMLYKGIRLEALQAEAGVFSSSHAREAAFSDEQWMDRIQNENNVCFGLWCNDELIGITGVVVEKETPGDGLMVQTYIRQGYRGKGLSRMMYEARLQWARARGLKRLITGHKESNIISKAANQHFGFRYTHNEERTWPDGSKEDIVYYELVL